MRIRALVASCGLVMFFIAGTPTEARAQSYVSPLVGFNFGGDSGCPTMAECEDKRLNAGVGLGLLGPVFGYETEFAYARNFFGEAPNLSSSVLTVMGNVMIVPAIGPIRPYALVGLGLIKSHVEFTTTSILTTDNNDFGWDVGGGVFILFGEHVGLRGDFRNFHTFQEMNIAGISAGDDTNLAFSRASAALVLNF